jgi:hypothetical protein
MMEIPGPKPVEAPDRDSSDGFTFAAERANL